MEIPFDRLQPETLRNLIEAFVGREGTDYGLRILTMEEKIAQVQRRLESGDAVILFDADSETCNIATRAELREFELRPPVAAPLPPFASERQPDRQSDRQLDRSVAQKSRDFDDPQQHPGDDEQSSPFD